MNINLQQVGGYLSALSVKKKVELHKIFLKLFRPYCVFLSTYFFIRMLEFRSQDKMWNNQISLCFSSLGGGGDEFSRFTDLKPNTFLCFFPRWNLKFAVN